MIDDWYLRWRQVLGLGGVAVARGPAGSPDGGDGGPPTPVSKLVPDGDGPDAFGGAVALANGGATALVGDRFAETPDGTSAGAAYAFDRAGGDWSQQSRIVLDDYGEHDAFGIAVALADDTALVGRLATADFDSSDSVGATYALERSDGGWTQKARLDPDVSGDTVVSGFGSAVALTGETALVGASAVMSDPPGGIVTGTSYVFERTDGDWAQVATLVPDDSDVEAFGSAVALTGETALVGAPAFEFDHEKAGAAYAFERTGGDWTRRVRLAPDDGHPGDEFGTAVALSGDTALVGARSQGDSEAGAAYVFERTGGEWSQRAKLVAADRNDMEGFGAAVALADDTALVGAPGAEGPGDEGGGAAYVFERAGGDWSRKTTLAPDGYGEEFGTAVALADDTALVGASSGKNPDGNRTGIAYVFEVST